MLKRVNRVGNKTLIMAINFNDPEVTYADPFLFTNNGKSLERNATYAPKSIGEITGVELRLLPPFIIDNRTPKIWPFPGYASLYCLSIVVSDVANELAGTIDLKGFPRIGDQEHLPINKTLFYWDKDGSGKAPQQLHVFTTIIKSKKGLRDVGEVLAGLKDDEGYKTLVQQLASLATGSTPYGAIIDIITQIAGIAGKLLGKVEDKPLGTIVNSFTAVYGELNKIGATQYTYHTRNADFSYDLVIQNAATEGMMEKTNPADIPLLTAL